MNSATLLIQNAKVYTVDPAHLQAETVVHNGHSAGALRGVGAVRKRKSWANEHPTPRLQLEQRIAGYTHDVAYAEKFVGRAA